MSRSTEERLQRLERELSATRRRATRSLIGLIGFGLVVASAVAWTWEGPPLSDRDNNIVSKQDSISVQKLIIKDAAGHTVASLGKTESGAELWFYDREGEFIRASLGMGGTGPALMLFGKDGQRRLQLAEVEGQAAATLYDTTGGRRAKLASATGGGGFALFDSSGTARLFLSTTSTGPTIDLSDEAGELRTQVGVGSTVTQDGRKTVYPESSLRLFGPDGDIISSLPR